jgi:UDP-glucose 4-epimerase
VREVIAAAERVTGKRIPVREAPRRPGDPPALVADAARARAVLQWTPSHSTLDTILATAWAWHLRRLPAAPPPAAGA